MKIFRILLLGLALALTGCGKPVPADKASYVGEWHNKIMYLLITQDGSVVYKRLKGGTTVSVNGPLKGFNGDSFDVGVGPISTTFKVGKPPYQENGQWHMVVDGVPLIKASGSSAPATPVPHPRPAPSGTGTQI